MEACRIAASCERDIQTDATEDFVKHQKMQHKLTTDLLSIQLQTIIVKLSQVRDKSLNLSDVCCHVFIMLPLMFRRFQS